MFLKEEEKYKKTDLINRIKSENKIITEHKAINILKKLKEYNIIRVKREQKNLSDLLDSDIEHVDIEIDSSKDSYAPTFVGIVIVDDVVIKIFPKYFLDEDIDKMDSAQKFKFKTVLIVLEKYNKSKEQIVKIVNDTTEPLHHNILAIELFLLRDYFENGTYRNSINAIETNGSGEILWEKTVNETFALISGNKPYYTKLKTIKTVNDNSDFVKRLYECVLTTISKNLEENDLLELFDFPKLDLSEENLTDFGETDYILYRIGQELHTEFNTRKQIILKLLRAYISNQSYNDNIDCNITMYGTYNYNLVWEDVCKVVLNNMLDKQLKDLQINLNDDDDISGITLKDIIEKPKWSEAKDSQYLETFEPDLITIKDGKFIILDAKYYCPKFENEQISNQPGIESIVKQYMYHLSFKEFIEKHNLKIKNAFLYPSDDISDFNEDNYCYNKGTAGLDILNNIGLEPIENKFLQASIMYDYYLNNQKSFDFSKIFKFQNETE